MASLLCLLMIIYIFNFSLLGGVQLFGMIKMLGLLKEDMTSSQNEWAWYGYQVRLTVSFKSYKNLRLCHRIHVEDKQPIKCKEISLVSEQFYSLRE